MNGGEFTAAIAEKIDTWLKEVSEELDEMIGDHIELIGQITPNRNVALVSIASRFATMHENPEQGEINELCSLLVLAIDRLAQQRQAS
ncbi:hypothetical protein AOT83_04555 [Mycobacteroides sp. H001]|uniref:hypothetical protein n=1 Tax=unclassified Mycobacteroides TaxID=2618759 RepID=UPI000715AAA2|nr:MULTISPECIES: hypothetical protein [unclassified Mycobacteroides]KRQ31377.1 hypothetical protein AOT86_01845 [Mycobacteroides sp. H072]KRQ35864.1 hypothetical protein AOT84_15260 [Mycobacteroides sp. H002]KRQ50596.1 hypothetical protein AOT85_13965 [Mycobacteroides sp. H054]KRQ72642.1 hypothetical protein AOT83_04555 [Mycobacteroides sp. H001]